MRKLQRRPQKLNALRGPQSSGKPFNQAHKRFTVAFDSTDDDHDQVGVWKQLGGVTHSVMDLLCPINFLQCFANHLDRDEFHYFVAKIEGQVEDSVPKIR